VGIHNNFEKFLSPVFHPGVTAYSPSSAAEGVQPAEPQREEGGPEILLMGISIVAALAGLFFAWLLYLNKPQLPQQIAKTFGSLYYAVLNKYYVDELYAALFVKPLLNGSTKLLWHGIDRDVIDATLDNSADGARELSDTVRHMQSGNVRSYAGWVAAGAAVVIGYMIWMGTR
jgi:NADH-quinone oxidoreductase subunit L